MYLAFIDDSRQLVPSRAGVIGPTVTGGGVLVAVEAGATFERRVNEVCLNFGFPMGEEFKWSPTKRHWMRDNLVRDARLEFWQAVVDVLEDVGAIVVIAIWDGRLTAALSEEESQVLTSFALLERLVATLTSLDDACIVVFDRPTGDRASELRFLQRCAEMLRRRFDEPGERLAAFPTITQSRYGRGLQVADLVASVANSYFAGEREYSPPVFERMRPLIPVSGGRRGGHSAEFRPSYQFANQYHWMLEDASYVRGGLTGNLPLARRPYRTDPWTP